jgi:hypothetical protein
MRFTTLTIGGVMLAAIIIAGCSSDKATTPMNNSAANLSKAEVYSITGTFVKNDNDCFFVTDNNHVQYELVFTNVKPPEFKNETVITVNGPFLSGPDLRCGFKGIRILVQSIFSEISPSTNAGTLTPSF